MKRISFHFADCRRERNENRNWIHLFSSIATRNSVECRRLAKTTPFRSKFEGEEFYAEKCIMSPLGIPKIKEKKKTEKKIMPCILNAYRLLATNRIDRTKHRHSTRRETEIQRYKFAVFRSKWQHVACITTFVVFILFIPLSRSTMHTACSLSLCVAPIANRDDIKLSETSTL